MPLSCSILGTSESLSHQPGSATAMARMAGTSDDPISAAVRRCQHARCITRQLETGLSECLRVRYGARTDGDCRCDALRSYGTRGQGMAKSARCKVDMTPWDLRVAGAVLEYHFIPWAYDQFPKVCFMSYALSPGFMTKHSGYLSSFTFLPDECKKWHSFGISKYLMRLLKCYGRGKYGSKN